MHEYNYFKQQLVHLNFWNVLVWDMIIFKGTQIAKVI